VSVSVDELRALHALADMAFDRERSALAPILAEEARLRARLADLDAQDRAARQGFASDARTRQVAADLHWQAWLVRNRTETQRELATVLARKAEVGIALKRAFGRVSATADLLKEAKLDKKRRDTLRAIDQLS
jgi:hypothetical protein